MKEKFLFFFDSFYLLMDIFDIVQIQKLVFVLDFFFIISLQKKQKIVNIHIFLSKYFILFFLELSIVRLESNDYAEVEFHQTQTYIPSMDYLGFGQCKPMRLLPKLIDNSVSKSRTPRFTMNGGNFPSLSNTNTNNSNSQKPSIVLKRDCNVDVDPKHISDILGDLITQWSQRTGTILGSNQVAFHLVPIPCDPFAEFDALRGRNNFVCIDIIHFIIS
jgi:hypothetical protein